MVKVIVCLEVFIINVCIVVDNSFECLVIEILRRVINIVLSGVNFVKLVINFVMMCCRFFVFINDIILIMLLVLCFFVFLGWGLVMVILK